MANAEKCKDCGEILGTNRNCQTCLQYLFDRGTNDITEEDVKDAYSRGETWFGSRGKSAPAALFSQVKLLWKMLGDYLSGGYRELSWGVVAAIAFAVLYVINPFDLVPDVIPVLGWIDDAAVTALVIRTLREQLRKYCFYIGLDPRDYGL